MQAVILAGGAGRRSAPLGLTRPKALFEVTGRPLIGHVLEGLRAAGITDAVLVTPPDDALPDHLGDGPAAGPRLAYAVQRERHGQADALLSARPHVGDGPLLVLNASDVYDPALPADLVALARRERPDVALVGRAVDTPERFGVMAFDGSGRLTGVVEKPAPEAAPSNVAVVGLYAFSPRIWDALDATPRGATDDQLERAYQRLIDDGNATHLAYDGPFAAFKHPWDLLAILDQLLAREATHRVDPSARVADSAVVEGDVVLSEGVRVFEGAVIRGPAYVGPHSIVGNGALLRGGVSIGHHCVVGYGTEISHSLVGNHSWFHMNYVGDSIIADNCSFGAGTITANLRFDERPVAVRVGDEGGRVSTGRAHFGAIMADDCRTGCNSVLLPGVKVGPNSVVGPGVVLERDLAAGRLALLAAGAYEERDNPIDVAQLSRAERLQGL